jgi:hypothetical protein
MESQSGVCVGVAADVMVVDAIDMTRRHHTDDSRADGHGENEKSPRIVIRGLRKWERARS